MDAFRANISERFGMLDAIFPESITRQRHGTPISNRPSFKAASLSFSTRRERERERCTLSSARRTNACGIREDFNRSEEKDAKVKKGE